MILFSVLEYPYSQNPQALLKYNDLLLKIELENMIVAIAFYNHTDCSPFISQRSLYIFAVFISNEAYS